MEECSCLHESTSSILASSFNFCIIVLFLPLLAMVGIFFNLLNIIVFSRRHDSTAAVYLTALSCSDLGVCLAGIMVISADSFRAYSHSVDQFFVFVLPKTIPIGLFFQMLSVYVTVIAAFDCFLSVRSPDGQVSPRSLAFLVFFVACYNAIQFGDLEAIHCMHPSKNISMYELCPTDLRISEAYVVYYKGYGYAVSMAFLPFVILSSLTLAILCLLRKRARPHLATGFSSPKAEASNPTVLLLVIVLFLVCNVTSLMVNVFDMLKISLGQELEAILIDIGNLLVVVNATANFIVYYESDAEFSREIRALFPFFFPSSSHISLERSKENGCEDNALENQQTIALTHTVPIFL